MNQSDVILASKHENKFLKQYHLRLAKAAIEGLSIPFRSKQSIVSDFVYINADFLQESYQNGQDVFLLTGHFFNWELGLAAAKYYLPYKIIGVYKATKNRHINRLIKSIRSRHTDDMITQERLLRMIVAPCDQPRLFLMIGDQNPSTDKRLTWLQFLGRKTAFNDGLERISLRYKIPVAYARILAVPGRYELSMHWLYEFHSNEATWLKKYVDALDDNVRALSSNWVWSHQRWKRNVELGID